MTISLEKQHSTSKPQIQIKRVYKHEISKVWRALTSKEALSEWLMETKNFELNVGAKFSFYTKPIGKFDGVVNCEVLEYNEPYIISYSWKASSMKRPTLVVWELKKLSKSETLLTLSHTKFEGLNGWITKQILRNGWKGILSKKLTKYLAI